MSAKKYTLVNFSNAIFSAVINFMMPALIGVENASQLQTFRRNVTTFSPLLDLGNSYEVARCGRTRLNAQLLTFSLVFSIVFVIAVLSQIEIIQADSGSVYVILCGMFTVIIYNCIAVNVAQKKLIKSAWINMIAVVVPAILAIGMYRNQADGLVGYVIAILIVALVILIFESDTIELRGGGSILENIKFGLPKSISNMLETAYLLPIINSALYHDLAYKIVFFSQVGRFVGGVINSNLVYAHVSESGLAKSNLAHLGLAIIACACIYISASYILPITTGFQYYSSENMSEAIFYALIILDSMLSMAVSGYLNLKIKMPLLGILNLFALILIASAANFEVLIVEWILAAHVFMLLVIVYRIFEDERIRR